MQRTERFIQPTIPQDFYWFNEPSRYRCGAGLEIFTNEKTDFWQRTHYGFQRDDGHCLLTKYTGDVSFMTHTEFRPHETYDQCGLIVRIDSQHWIKVSTEYENESVSRLGSVVTNGGYSDWATQDIPSNQHEMWYRINKRGSDFLLEHSYNGHVWSQMRVAHLHKEAASYEIGVYACSPIGKGYWCRFTTLEIASNTWQVPSDVS